MLVTCIKRFIKKSRFLFILFILIQIISVFAVEYSFLSYRKQQIERSVYSDGVATFSIIYQNGVAFGKVKNKLQALTESTPVNIKFCYIDCMDNEQLRAYAFGRDVKILYGNNFSDNNQTIISHDLYLEGVRIGDRLSLFNNEYQVCGVINFSYSEIPFSSVSDNEVIRKIVLETRSIPTKHESEQLLSYLSQEFPNGLVVLPEGRDMNTEYFFDTQTVVSFSLFILAMINISYLFKHIVEKRKKYYAISMCCGASSLRMKCTLIAESMIYAFISTISGLLVFRLLLLNLLFEESRFSVSDFVLSAFVCFAMILVPVLATLFNFSTKTIKQLICSGDI